MCMRGGQKYRNLNLSICEGGGSLGIYRKRLRRENKVVHCHFHILEMYMSRLPMKAKEKDTA